MKKIILSLALGPLLFGVTPTNMTAMSKSHFSSEQASSWSDLTNVEKVGLSGICIAGSATILLKICKIYYTNKAATADLQINALEEKLRLTSDTNEQKSLKKTIALWKQKKDFFTRKRNNVRLAQKYANFAIAGSVVCYVSPTCLNLAVGGIMILSIPFFVGLEVLKQFPALCR